jgi:hypothetical protein
MEIIISLLALLVALAIFAGVVFLIVLGVKFLGSMTSGTAVASQEPDQMNQGDFHSGPEGYSASSGYQDTFYGSRGFGSADELDGHDEGDFNR